MTRYENLVCFSLDKTFIKCAKQLEMNTESTKDIHLIQIHYISLHILTNLTSDLNTTTCLVAAVSRARLTKQQQQDQGE